MDLLNFKLWPDFTPKFLTKRILGKINIENNSRDYGKIILNESLGSFNNQKEMSIKVVKDILDVCYGNFSNVTNTNLLEFDDENIKTVTSTIHKIYGYTKAELNNITDEGEVKITIYISYNDIRSLDKKELSKKLLYIIAHELMHSNIFYKRLKNGQNINDVDENYFNALKIYREIENDDIISGFAYALYNTNYNEVQTIISQTNTQLYFFFKDNKLNVEENLIEAIKNTDGYTIYSNNLMVCNVLRNDTFKKKRIGQNIGTI